MRRGQKVTRRKLEADNNGHPPVTVGWHQHTKEKAAVRNKSERERWCGRARWWICRDMWAVAMEWPVSGGDPQVFRFICFYSSLYSRVFPRC